MGETPDNSKYFSVGPLALLGFFFVIIVNRRRTFHKRKRQSNTFCIIFILHRGGVHITRTECAVDCSTEVDRIVDALDDRKVLFYFFIFYLIFLVFYSCFSC